MGKHYFPNHLTLQTWKFDGTRTKTETHAMAAFRTRARVANGKPSGAFQGPTRRSNLAPEWPREGHQDGRWVERELPHTQVVHSRGQQGGAIWPHNGPKKAIRIAIGWSVKCTICLSVATQTWKTNGKPSGAFQDYFGGLRRGDLAPRCPQNDPRMVIGWSRDAHPSYHANNYVLQNINSSLRAPRCF